MRRALLWALTFEYVGWTWVPETEDGVYKLQTCPRGYSRQSIDDGATATDQQRCDPCGEGSECVLEVCETSGRTPACTQMVQLAAS